MFDNKNKAQSSLCQSDNPLPTFGHSGTDILSTNKEINRACIRYKVIIDDPISLLIISLVLIAGVINDLIEKILFLCILMLNLRGFSKKTPLRRIIPGKSWRNQCNQNDDE